jgi:hypothetical protein
LPTAWLIGAGVVLVATFLPWAHVSAPFFGTIVWTGFDASGWLLPLLALGIGACAALEAVGSGSSLSRRVGAGISVVSALTVGAEFVVAGTQLGQLVQDRHSLDPMTAGLAQLTSATLDVGLFLALIGSLAATTAAALINRREIP